MVATKFRMGASTYAIVRRRDIMAIRSSGDVDRVLNALEGDRGGGAIRQMIDDVRPVPLMLNADELHRLAAKLLESGELAVVRLDEQLPRLDPPKVIDAPVQPLAPAPVEAVTEWVALRLVDADGEPVANEPYELELADGTRVAGRTDVDGRAKHDGVPRGSCRISFPQVWSSEWRAEGEALARPEATPTAGPSTGGAAPGSAPGEDDDVGSEPRCAPPSDLVAPPEIPTAAGATWLVLEIEEVDGRSLRNVPISIELPSGVIVDRELDDLGRVELLDIADAGSCRVRSATDGYRLPRGTYATGAAYLIVAERTGKAIA